MQVTTYLFGYIQYKPKFFAIKHKHQVYKRFWEVFQSSSLRLENAKPGESQICDDFNFI